MSIVLKENEWAEDMIHSNSLGKKPSETLRRAARYYLDMNYRARDVRNLLETYILRCDPNISLPKWSGTINRAISKAERYKAIEIDYIEITGSEVEIIGSLKGRQIQRLAFTLLCLSKFWTMVDPSRDYWIINKDSEIMSMANINTSIKRQSEMYWELRELGLIRFSKKVDNTNVRVCFVSEGECVLKISDFRNLGYQYLKFCGEPYFECQNCGLVVKMSNPIKGRKQKYCVSCASEVAVKQRSGSYLDEHEIMYECKNGHILQ